jgi:hypothetical protein
MKTITLKEACEILENAEAIMVHDCEDRLSSPFHPGGVSDCWQEIIQVEECDGSCEDCSSIFTFIGDSDYDDPLFFPAEHNTLVKIDSDGDMLLYELDKSAPIKISILIKKNLNTP